MNLRIPHENTFLGSAFSGLCQRVLRELILMGHQVDQHYGMDEPVLRQQLALFQPELIICPFLTHRIPDDIWQSHRCLIVHPVLKVTGAQAPRLGHPKPKRGMGCYPAPGGC